MVKRLTLQIKMASVRRVDHFWLLGNNDQPLRLAKFNDRPCRTIVVDRTVSALIKTLAI